MINANYVNYLNYVIIALFLFSLLFVVWRNPWGYRVFSFTDQFSADYASALSPIVVEVRERIDAGDRLLIVRPLGWYIYTPDGMAFYYFTNQIAVECPEDRISAVVYRLATEAEDRDGSSLDRLRTKCLNYKLDTLVRLFAARFVRRTDVDLSRVAPFLKKITIESTLNALLAMNVI